MAIQDGLLLEFGINDPHKGYGLIQTVETEQRIERALDKAPDGSPTSIQEYNEHTALTLSYIPLVGGSTDADNPVIGAGFTYSGSTYFIDRISNVEQVDGFPLITVEAITYPKVF